MTTLAALAIALACYREYDRKFWRWLALRSFYNPRPANFGERTVIAIGQTCSMAVVEWTPDDR